MAAIRDGLGRVRVAGEAIYQRRRKIERQRERDIPRQRVASPPMVAVTTPFLLLPFSPFSLRSPPRLIPSFSLLHVLVSPFLPLLAPRSRPSSSLSPSLSLSLSLNSSPWSPRVRSRKYKRRRRLMGMDETRERRNGRSGNSGKSNGEGWKVEVGGGRRRQFVASRD